MVLAIIDLRWDTWAVSVVFPIHFKYQDLHLGSPKTELEQPLSFENHS